MEEFTLSGDGVRTAADQSPAEEVANAITHGVGAVLAAVGLAVLVTLAKVRGDMWRVVAFSIYGGCMLMSYISSAWYHWCRPGGMKHVLRVLDHSAVYLLIAGTYTPVLLVPLRGGWGWSLFGVVWGLAVVGVVFKMFFVRRFEVLSTIVYVAMGWLGIIAVRPVIEQVSTAGAMWLMGGGIVYTVGVVFFLWERLPFNHAIWHLFVIGGSVCHFVAMVGYVLPMRG